MLASVKASDILEVIWVSLLAGVLVCLTFALVVLGSARSAEARRQGSSAASVVYGVLAGIAFAAFAGAVAYGVHILLSKG